MEKVCRRDTVMGSVCVGLGLGSLKVRWHWSMVGWGVAWGKGKERK